MQPYFTNVHWFWPIGWLAVLVFFIIIMARFRGERWRHHGPHALPDQDPLTVLKRRYAAGEITKQQFEEMKADIK
jgi:uncharacterized membrane protein